MAVASVVPEGFEANINQHIVAIRTRDLQTSKTLAAYLNLDVAEKLASRRATGGTRPALDYLALLSIPIIFDNRIKELVHLAIQNYMKKVNDAQRRLDSIDDILLEELGVRITQEFRSKITDRIFMRQNSSISGSRLDAPSNWKILSLKSRKYELAKFKNIVFINPRTNLPSTGSMPVTFVPMDAISHVNGEIAEYRTRTISESKGFTIFQENDILWAKITPSMENGKAAIAKNLENGYGFGSTEFHVFRIRQNNVDANFLYLLLRLKIVRQFAQLFFSGSAGQQRVDEGFFKKLEIPLPPVDAQLEISKRIFELKNRSKEMLMNAETELRKTYEEIENEILQRQGVAK
jgi:restriction endonuclease S subunit